MQPTSRQCKPLRSLPVGIEKQTLPEQRRSGAAPFTCKIHFRLDGKLVRFKEAACSFPPSI
jgi:hypothetical protein